MKNTGGRAAGTINAGVFLKEFVPEGVPWAHLDVAGVAHFEKEQSGWPPGASGFGVALTIEFLKKRFGSRRRARSDSPHGRFDSSDALCYESRAAMPLRDFTIGPVGEDVFPRFVARLAEKLDDPSLDRNVVVRDALAQLYLGRTVDHDAILGGSGRAAGDEDARRLVRPAQRDARGRVLPGDRPREVGAASSRSSGSGRCSTTLRSAATSGSARRCVTCWRSASSRSAARSVRIFHEVEFSFGYNLTVGDGVTIHRNVLIDDRGEVVIGDDASISDYANIYSHSHAVEDIHDVVARAGPRSATGPASRTTPSILSGVKVGKDAIVGSMGVASKPVEPGCDRRRHPGQAHRAEERQAVTRRPGVDFSGVLRRLTVRNLAIVEDLELELADGSDGRHRGDRRRQVDPGRRALARSPAAAGSADLIREGAAAPDRRRPSSTRTPRSGRLVADAGPAGRGERTVLLRRELTPDGRGPRLRRGRARRRCARSRSSASGSSRSTARAPSRSSSTPAAPLELLDAFAKTDAERDGRRGGRGRVEGGAASGSQALEASRRRARASGSRCSTSRSARSSRSRPTEAEEDDASGRARAAPARRPDPPRRRDRARRAVRGRGLGGRPARRGRAGVRGARGDRSAPRPRTATRPRT